MSNDSYSPLMPEEEQGGKSALVLVIIIIILLLIGGVYAINSQKTEEAAPASQTTDVDAVSTSTSLDDIDKDLNALDTSANDAELNNLDKEVQGL